MVKGNLLKGNYGLKKLPKSMDNSGYLSNI